VKYLIMSPILITTSHKPSQRTRSFIKDLHLILPFSIRITRGKKTLSELGIIAHVNNKQYLFIIGEKKGNPATIRIYSLDKTSYYPRLKDVALITLRGVKLTREIPDASRAYNPSKIWVDYEKCVEERCFKIVDLINMIYSNQLDRSKYDILYTLEDVGDITVFKPLNRLNKICGPVLKISNVKIYGE